MKIPDRLPASTGILGEQLNLIDPPPFSPQFPPQSSLTSKALKLLLSGRTLTHPEFEDLTGSWRLGAYICTLREMYWPIQTHEIVCPSPDCPDRVIARYVMPQWVMSQLGGNHGA